MERSRCASLGPSSLPGPLPSSGARWGRLPAQMPGVEPATAYPTSGRGNDIRFAVQLGTPGPTSPSSPKDGEVVRRQAEWEREIECLDQKEMELHQSQLKLIREQTAIFIHDLSVLQQEVAMLRSGTMERLEVLERTVGSTGQKRTQDWAETHDKLESLHGRLASHNSLLHDRETQHKSLQTRVDQLEKLLGDTQGSHAQHIKELEATKAAHAKLSHDVRARDAHHASVMERLEYLERSMGDSADQHAQQLKDAAERLEHLHGRVTACEAHGGHIEGLRRAHENLMGDGQRREAQHASVVERLDYFERGMGDSIGRNARELQAAHNKLEQLHTQLSEHHGALDDRASQHSSLRDRVDYLEQTLGESINRHTRELEASRNSHGKLVQEHKVRETHHASLVQRLEYLEKALGDSSDKHAQELEATRSRLEQAHSRLGEHHQQLLQHTSLQDRVKFLEKLIGDNADKHSKELAGAVADVEHLRGRLSACEAHGAAIEGLKKSHTNFASDKARRDAQHSSMAERLDHFEQTLDRTADKHSRELAGAHGAVEQLHGRLAACEKHGAALTELQKSHATLSNDKAALEHHHATLKSRLEFLEKAHEETSEKHGKEVESMKTTHAKLMSEVRSRDGGHASVAEKLERLEGHVNSSAGKHSQELSEALKKVEQLHGRVTSCEQHGTAIEGLKKAHHSLANDRAAKEAHHSSLSERLGYLEQVLGDSADQHAQGLKATQSHVDQLQAKLSEEKTAREAHHAAITGQLAKHGEAQDKLHASVQERLTYLESMIGESADHHMRELEGTKAAHSRLSSEMKAREAHHASVAERLDAIEALLGDTTNKHGDALASAHAKLEHLQGKIADGRTAQEEHFRGIMAKDREARDAHHASLQERLAFVEKLLGESADQHARELESVKLAHGQLAKESKGRETRHASLADRIEQLERALEDSSDKHARDLQAKHDHLERRLQTCERSTATAPAAENPGDKAKVKELDRHHATLKERVDYLENALGDNVDRHARELDALRSTHAKLQNEAKAREAHHASFSERLEYVEKLLGDSEDRHQQELKAHKGKLEQLHGRVADCEEHGTAIESLRKAHSNLVNDKAARDAHHSSMSERLEYLERLLGDSAERRAKVHDGRQSPLADRLEHLERVLGDTEERRALEVKALVEQVDRCRRASAVHSETRFEARDVHHASVAERLSFLEKMLGDSQEKHGQELKAAHSRLEQLHGRLSACEAHSSAMDGLRQSQVGLAKDRAALDAHHASVAERLDYLERLTGDSADRHAKELASAHAKIEQLHGVLKEEKAAREVHHAAVDGLLSREREGRGAHQASFEDRLRFLEGLLQETSGKHSDLHERLQAEAQLRAQHHDAVAEHLTREQRAREQHEKAVQSHLGNERKARETHESLVQEMFGHEKAARDRHLTHIQDQFVREKEARDKHHETHQEQLNRHRAMTESTHKEMFDMLHKEKASREQFHAAHQEQLQRERASRGVLEEQMSQERNERCRHHDAANERVDSLQRTMNIFDSLIRKEMEERTRESRRIWDAIDNHTHDLSTQVVSERGKDFSEALLDTTPQHRLTRSASPTPQVFALPSPVGTVQFGQTPYAEPVSRVPQATIAASPPTVRLQSPLHSPPYGGALPTAPALQPAPVLRTVGSQPHLQEPLEQHAERVERINCGHTRYYGERHRAAEFVID